MPFFNFKSIRGLEVAVNAVSEPDRKPDKSIKINKQIIDNNNQHIGTDHQIKIVYYKISQIFNSKIIEVNSYHKNMINIDNLGIDLNIFATYEPDKSIEGFIHSSLPIIGVMWHPERNPNQINKQIISKIFKDEDFWNKLN